MLRDLISPYLLRRRKADVATQLPKKTETVLFCSLTETQRDLYRSAAAQRCMFRVTLDAVSADVAICQLRACLHKHP